jgi:phage-related minor tail protein
MADVLEQLNVLLSLDASEFDRGTRDVANRAERSGNRISGALSAGMGAAATGIAASATIAVGAIAGIGAAAISAQGRVATLEKAFGGALDEATADALFLADAYDQDLTEAARSAQRVQDEFGTSAEDAFLVLTEGQELGLDRFSDLNDTLNEYSDDFADLGVTGFDSLALINEGLEAGFMNTDKVGDAFNEFGIRLRDPAVIKNIRDIDESTAELFDQFARGEITQRQAFERIADSIESIEDPLLRQEAGVQAFGVTFEDFGADATFALGEALEGVEALGTEIEESGRQYGTFGALWAGITSEATAALAPLGDKLLEIANEAMPHIISAIEWFGTNAPGWIDMAVGALDRFMAVVVPLARYLGFVLEEGDYLNDWLWHLPDAMQPVVQFIGELIFQFQQLAGQIGAIIGPLVSSIQGAFQGAEAATQGFSMATIGLGEQWAMLQQTLGAVVTAITSIVQSGFGIIQAFLQENGASIQMFFQTTWQQITTIISLAIQLIDATIVPTLQGIAAFIAAHGDEIVGILTMAWQQISTAVGLFLDAITAAITLALQIIDGNWRGAWQTIQQFSLQFVLTFAQMFENGFNMIVEIVRLAMAAFGIDIDAAFAAAVAGFQVFRANFIDPIIAAFQAIGQAIQNAIGNILNLGEKLRNIRPPDWLSQWGTDIQEGAGVVASQFGERAMGGTGSGWTVVGEQGPELVNLGQASAVLPAGVTGSAMGRGNASVSMNMNIGSVDSAERAQQVADMAAARIMAALEYGQDDVLKQGVR